MTSETVISIFLGVGLAASVGFRVFLPLFALSLAAYFNVWELNDSWQWIGSLAAVIQYGPKRQSARIGDRHSYQA